MNRDELPQMAAAGGLVLAGGQALLIRKHRLWDLPKGKLSENELPELCAIREIAEETGLDPELLSIRAPLCDPAMFIYAIWQVKQDRAGSVDTRQDFRSATLNFGRPSDSASGWTRHSAGNRATSRLYRLQWVASEALIQTVATGARSKAPSLCPRNLANLL